MPQSSHSPVPVRAIRLWLWVVAAFVMATVIVGGATRLTESGLSIVEWKPVTGVWLPLTAENWQAEFEKYQQIPQYREVNRGMSLDEFKIIYGWEWAHRILGRLIGVVFLLPFIFFLWRGWIPPQFRARLWMIFGLGALQGAVGWWMVSSGLAERVTVSPYRLAFHMTLACVIYAAVVWTIREMRGPAAVTCAPGFRASAVLFAVLVLLQIYSGALVAGTDAGLTYNTWPLIDGSFIPAGARMWFETPWWRNIFENTLAVQFNHRMLAYVLWFFAVAYAGFAILREQSASARTWAIAIAITVTGQAVLGIATLLAVVPMSLAMLHQIAAMVVLTLAVINAARMTREKAALVQQPSLSAS